MMIVLKCFLKSRGLNETYSGGVGSFLLTLMVVSYLQQKYKDGNTERIDLGKHLMDFFYLYGTRFNYEEVGISVRQGGYYYSKIKRGFMDSRNPFKLSVENPQDPTMDLGRGSFNIRKVHRAFQHAYDTLVYNNQGAQSLLSLIITASPDELNPGWREQQEE